MKYATFAEVENITDQLGFEIVEEPQNPNVINSPISSA